MHHSVNVVTQVFAINSDETSNKSFTAFQALAKQQNGTAANTTTSGTAASASSTANSGANAVHARASGLALTISVIAVVGSFL
jgi:hypothetical protein